MKLFISDFLVRLGTAILKKKIGGWLGSFLFAGPIGYVISFFAEKILNTLITRSIITIDIYMNNAKEDLSAEEYEKFALESYKKVTKKVYSEEEKAKFRQEYLDALSGVGTFGVSKR